MFRLSKEEMYEWLISETREERISLLEDISKANAVGLSLMDYTVFLNPNVILNSDGTFSYVPDYVEGQVLSQEELKKTLVEFKLEVYEDESDQLITALEEKDISYEEEEPFTTNEDDTMKVQVTFIATVADYVDMVYTIDNDEFRGDLLSELS